MKTNNYSGFHKLSVSQRAAEVAAVSNLNGPAQGCFFGGRTRPSEVFALWPTLIPREAITIETHVEEV